MMSFENMSDLVNHVLQLSVLRWNPIGQLSHVAVIQVVRIEAPRNSLDHLLINDEANQVAKVLVDVEDGQLWESVCINSFVMDEDEQNDEEFLQQLRKRGLEEGWVLFVGFQYVTVQFLAHFGHIDLRWQDHVSVDGVAVNKVVKKEEDICCLFHYTF